MTVAALYMYTVAYLADLSAVYAFMFSCLSRYLHINVHVHVDAHVHVRLCTHAIHTWRVTKEKDILKQVGGKHCTLRSLS